MFQIFALPFGSESAPASAAMPPVYGFKPDVAHMHLKGYSDGFVL